MINLSQLKLKPNIALWVEDLETTDEPQTRSYLTRIYSGAEPIGDCCLGRACKLAVKAGVVRANQIGKLVEYFGPTVSNGEIDSSLTSLPQAVSRWLGIPSSWSMTDPLLGETHCSRANDVFNWSFKQIAAAIRCQPWAYEELT